MKRLALIAVFALLMMAVAATGTSAQAPTYSVGVQIKNMDTSTAATVTITYYDQATGNVASTYTVPGGIPAGSSFTMAELQGVNTGFNGSAVINSDRPVAAIGNVFANGFSGMGASYTAFTGGESTTNLPLILRGHYGFNTWFSVQNVGSVDAPVTVTYNNGATETATVKPGASKSFMQESNAGLPDPAPNSPAGYVGSAIITSNNGQPIVATLLEQGPTTLLGYDSFGNSIAATNPVMPLINANNFGFITGIQLQNTGNQATSVTISYTASLAGANCAETLNVPAKSSASFALDAFRTTVAGENCADGGRFIGSARVTANSASQPLVAIVNQLNTSTNKGAAYNAFNPASGTATVELPLIMDRNYGYVTGYSIVNVGGQATTITCRYTNNARVDTATVQPGAALAVENANTLANGYVGAATCTATGGDTKIVGVVNEFQSSASLDSLLVYEGANR